VSVDRLRPATAALTLLLWATAARAGTVAIVQPTGPTAGLTETLSRLHGELLSVGLEVKIIAPPANRGTDRADSRAWIARIAAEGGIDAVIDVGGDNGPDWVDVWVIGKSPRRLELSRVVSEPNAPNASERLAIRAIEVLRSSFLESNMSSTERSSVPTAQPATDSRPRGERDGSPRRPERIGIAVGASMFTSLDGLGPAISPIARLDWVPLNWLGAHAEVAGLGTRPFVATAAGNARISQQYALLGGSYRLRFDQGLTAFVALSAGALHTSVRGATDAPRLGHTATQWSLLLDAGVGAGLHLPGRYYVCLAGHVYLAEPYVAIHFMDETIATSGRPNLGLTLTVGGWL
jgi:hypothetical protein